MTPTLTPSKEIKIVKHNTPKQRKLIRILSENIGNKGNTKTIYEMMLEAGYSKTTAHQQSCVLAGIKEELKPIAQELEDIRNKAIQRIKKGNLTNQADYKELIDGIDKLTKNIQLLNGRPTGIGILGQISINQFLDDLNAGKFPEIEG